MAGQVHYYLASTLSWTTLDEALLSIFKLSILFCKRDSSHNPQLLLFYKTGTSWLPIDFPHHDFCFEDKQEASQLELLVLPKYIKYTDQGYSNSIWLSRMLS